MHNFRGCLVVEFGASRLTARPAKGRIFDRGRRIRLADVDPRGRCRLDAIVRHLQDVARDDSADSKLTNPMNWIVRRNLIAVRTAPVYQEWVKLSTWCSGYGSRWAERRTEVRGQQGAEVEAVTIWVHIDIKTMRPARLSDDFFRIWGESTNERRVNARTRLPVAWPSHAQKCPWPLRFTDIDLLGHVNNAAQWAAVEHVLNLNGLPNGPFCAEIEYGSGVKLEDEVNLRWLCQEDRVDTWLTSENVARSTAQIRPLPASSRAFSSPSLRNLRMGHNSGR